MILKSKLLFFSVNTWKFTSTRRDRNRTCSISPPPEISEERDKFSRAFWRARPRPTEAGRRTLRADVGAVTRTAKLQLWFRSLKIIWSLLQFSPKTRRDKLILNSGFIPLSQLSNSSKSSWACKPNPEDQINRKPHDRILHHKSEKKKNIGRKITIRPNNYHMLPSRGGRAVFKLY